MPDDSEGHIEQRAALDLLLVSKAQGGQTRYSPIEVLGLLLASSNQVYAPRAY